MTRVMKYKPLRCLYSSLWRVFLSNWRGGLMVNPLKMHHMDRESPLGPYLSEGCLRSRLGRLLSHLSRMPPRSIVKTMSQEEDRCLTPWPGGVKVRTTCRSMSHGPFYSPRTPPWFSSSHNLFNFFRSNF